MKLIIEPIALNWEESKKYAKIKGGRLPSPSELLKWSSTQAINVDIWTHQEDVLSPDQAMYLHWKKGIPLSKKKNKRCLMVYVIEDENKSSPPLISGKKQSKRFKARNYF